MSKNRLYLLIFMACFISWAWILLVSIDGVKHSGMDLTVCVFKRISGLPCPSCGTTRAVYLLLQGEIGQSLRMNPLGIPIFCILLLVPIWIIWDSLLQRTSFYDFYLNILDLNYKREIALALLFLLLLNWAWNVYKVL